MRSLGEDYTIVIVTHIKQQAAGVSAFITTCEDKAGVLVEYGPNSPPFANPKDKRSGDYITGRFG